MNIVMLLIKVARMVSILVSIKAYGGSKIENLFKLKIVYSLLKVKCKTNIYLILLPVSS